MVKIDLITGFLGSGKTTFIKKYAKYLIDQGLNIGILENDFGAVNVDMMLLQDIAGEKCTLEMVAGGCDKDCHRRRFRTKLIAMGMCGYDRVLIEPSGIFDMDECTVSKKTRDYLTAAEKRGRVVNVSFELPKSFVVCEKNGKITVYISQLSSKTLIKRSQSPYKELMYR